MLVCVARLSSSTISDDVCLFLDFNYIAVFGKGKKRSTWLNRILKDMHNMQITSEIDFSINLCRLGDTWIREHMIHGDLTSIQTVEIHQTTHEAWITAATCGFLKRAEVFFFSKMNFNDMWKTDKVSVLKVPTSVVFCFRLDGWWTRLNFFRVSWQTGRVFCIGAKHD